MAFDVREVEAAWSWLASRQSLSSEGTASTLSLLTDHLNIIKLNELKWKIIAG